MTNTIDLSKLEVGNKYIFENKNGHFCIKKVHSKSFDKITLVCARSSGYLQDYTLFGKRIYGSRTTSIKSFIEVPSKSESDHKARAEQLQKALDVAKGLYLEKCGLVGIHISCDSATGAIIEKNKNNFIKMGIYDFDNAINKILTTKGE